MKGSPKGSPKGGMGGKASPAWVRQEAFNMDARATNAYHDPDVHGYTQGREQPLNGKGTVLWGTSRAPSWGGWEEEDDWRSATQGYVKGDVRSNSVAGKGGLGYAYAASGNADFLRWEREQRHSRAQATGAPGADFTFANASAGNYNNGGKHGWQGDDGSNPPGGGYAASPGSQMGMHGAGVPGDSPPPGAGVGDVRAGAGHGYDAGGAPPPPPPDANGRQRRGLDVGDSFFPVAVGPEAHKATRYVQNTATNEGRLEYRVLFVPIDAANRTQGGDVTFDCEVRTSNTRTGFVPIEIEYDIKFIKSRPYVDTVMLAARWRFVPAQPDMLDRDFDWDRAAQRYHEWRETATLAEVEARVLGEGDAIRFLNGSTEEVGPDADAMFTVVPRRSNAARGGPSGTSDAQARFYNELTNKLNAPNSAPKADVLGSDARLEASLKSSFTGTLKQVKEKFEGKGSAHIERKSLTVYVTHFYLGACGIVGKADDRDVRTRALMGVIQPFLGGVGPTFMKIWNSDSIVQNVKQEQGAYEALKVAFVLYERGNGIGKFEDYADTVQQGRLSAAEYKANFEVIFDGLHLGDVRGDGLEKWDEEVFTLQRKIKLFTKNATNGGELKKDLVKGGGPKTWEEVGDIVGDLNVVAGGVGGKVPRQTTFQSGEPISVVGQGGARQLLGRLPNKNAVNEKRVGASRGEVRPDWE